jgi:hypothetical protein
MEQKDFFKILGIIVVCFFIIFTTMKMFNLQGKSPIVEGLTNNSSSSTSTKGGEAGSAESYAASIKAQTVKLQDELLISKYRKEYEAAIINLDDYIGYLMIKQTLNMKPDGDSKTNIENINALNILKSAKESLNTTMTFLDKQ